MYHLNQGSGTFSFDAALSFEWSRTEERFRTFTGRIFDDILMMPSVRCLEMRFSGEGKVMFYKKKSVPLELLSFFLL